MMRQTTQLLDALKHFMRAKGLTYKDLGVKLGVSEVTVKRIFSQHSITLARLEEICAALQISLFDLTRLATQEQGNDEQELSLPQEQALAENPTLLTCFYLLINGWSVDEIAQEYGIADIPMTKLLTTLDKLKLIELLPKNRVHLLTSRVIAWRRNGPVYLLYENRVKREFLDYAFKQAGDNFMFETAELSEASVRILERKLKQLYKDFDYLAELDIALPLKDKRRVGLLSALRPWEYRLIPKADKKK